MSQFFAVGLWLVLLVCLAWGGRRLEVETKKLRYWRDRERVARRAGPFLAGLAIVWCFWTVVVFLILYLGE